MGYEINGKPMTEAQEAAGEEWDCWAVYKTIAVINGETVGRAHDTEDEAIEAAREMVRDLYGNPVTYHSDDAGKQVTKRVETMGREELAEALIDHDQVAFADVALREELFS
jgi:hypothetical protein